jgi:hypothetical protein
MPENYESVTIPESYPLVNYPWIFPNRKDGTKPPGNPIQCVMVSIHWMLFNDNTQRRSRSGKSAE